MTKNAASPTPNRMPWRISSPLSAETALYSTTIPRPTIATTIKSRGMSTTKPLTPLLRPPLAALPHSRLASDIVIRSEIEVQDLARDGRGRAAAAAAVLDDDAERNTRRLGRRECDEQAVVAVPLVDVLLAIPLVLRDADDLGSACLAGD